MENFKKDVLQAGIDLSAIISNDYDVNSSLSKDFALKTQNLSSKLEKLLKKLIKNDKLSEEQLIEHASKLKERAHSNLDQIKGISSSVEKVAVQLNKNQAADEEQDSLRPQLKFHDWPIDNTNKPFKPKLKEKPNAIVPLSENFQPKTPSKIPPHLQEHLTSLGLTGSSLTEYFSNPYEEEIKTHLEQSIPKWIYSDAIKFPLRKRTKKKPSLGKKRNPKALKKDDEEEEEVGGDSLDKTPFLFVNTEETLLKMISHLTEEPHLAIAIDLEHHNRRSYQGFTCLMQLSTFSRDFIIDTLLLREHMHQLLSVFTNPSIIKVLHGSDSDIDWLQKDFGLYVVQLFDTGQAARILGYESASLAYLLDRHCSVKANKGYQLADWRKRPIPADMMKYAREDTHFLLGIFDALRIELIKLGKTQKLDAVYKVFENSANIAMKTYEKPIVTSTSYLNLVKGENYTKDQLNIISNLYKWRDNCSRELDESTEYILANRTLLRIARVEPKTPQALVQVLEGTNIFPVVVARLNEVLDCILKARPTDEDDENDVLIERKPNANLSVLTSSPPPTLVAREPNQFSIGLNSSFGTFSIQKVLDDAVQQRHLSSVEVVISREGVLRNQSKRRKIADKVNEFNEILKEKEHEEMKIRMKTVEDLSQNVNNLLDEIMTTSKKPKVEETESDSFPSSLMERFDMKQSSQNKPVSKTEITSTFQFSKDLAAAAGAIAPEEVISKKKKSKTAASSSSSSLKPSKPQAPSKEEEEGKTNKEQKATSKPKANPYLLKPSRRFTVMSTSFVPK